MSNVEEALHRQVVLLIVLQPQTGLLLKYHDDGLNTALN